MGTSYHTRTTPLPELFVALVAAIGGTLYTGRILMDDDDDDDDDAGFITEIGSPLTIVTNESNRESAGVSGAEDYSSMPSARQPVTLEYFVNYISDTVWALEVAGDPVTVYRAARTGISRSFDFHSYSYAILRSLRNYRETIEFFTNKSARG